MAFTLRISYVLHVYSQQSTVMEASACKLMLLGDRGTFGKEDPVRGPWVTGYTLWEGGFSPDPLSSYKRVAIASLVPLIVSRKHHVLQSSTTSALMVSLPPLQRWSLSFYVWLEINYVFLCQEGIQPRGGSHHRVCAMLWIMMLPGCELNNLLLHERYFSSNTRLTNSTISSTHIPLSNLQRPSYSSPHTAILNTFSSKG